MPETENKPENAPISKFQLEEFEWLVTSKQHEQASRLLIYFLGQLDSAYGEFGANFFAQAPMTQWSPPLREHLCTRLAGAITTMFSHPDFDVSPSGFNSLMVMHRWLSTIFAVSPYKNGDHIIRNRNGAGGGVIAPIKVNDKNVRVFCLSFYPDSTIDFNLDALWGYNKDVTVMLALSLISNRALPTVNAHQKREQLLPWLATRLKEVHDLNCTPRGVLHDIYMHCSYADMADKHRIKEQIGRLLKEGMLKDGMTEMTEMPPKRTKPIVAVVLEWFSRQHSIYRTHSLTIAALREKYEVIGIAQPDATDETTQKVFDSFREIPAGNLIRGAYDIIKEIQPDAIYYPSVGMFPLTMHLVNLRLAPMQVMGLGHPATTHSPEIDGVLVEEDYVGDPDCFSEKLLIVPKDGLPYRPPEGVKRTPAKNRTKRDEKAPVRIAVCSSVMKINPGFLATLAEITRRSMRPIQFSFYLGLGKGITADYVRQAIADQLPGAEVNDHMAVDAYQAALNSCDLFVNPFPFGNTNGLVDTVRQGLPGVCMTGPEVHTHIDEGLFRRLGLPEELIASDKERYIRATLKLIENDDFRNAIHTRLLTEDVEQVLFKGKPEKFVRVFEKAYEEKVKH